MGWRDVARQPGGAVGRRFIVYCRGRPRTGRLVVVMRRRHMRRRVLGKETAGITLRLNFPGDDDPWYVIEF